jgi:hypothetical protein
MVTITADTMQKTNAVVDSVSRYQRRKLMAIMAQMYLTPFQKWRGTRPSSK